MGKEGVEKEEKDGSGGSVDLAQQQSSWPGQRQSWTSVKQVSAPVPLTAAQPWPPLSSALLHYISESKGAKELRGKAVWLSPNSPGPSQQRCEPAEALLSAPLIVLTSQL